MACSLCHQAGHYRPTCPRRPPPVPPAAQERRLSAPIPAAVPAPPRTYRDWSWLEKVPRLPTRWAFPGPRKDT